MQSHGCIDSGLLRGQGEEFWIKGLGAAVEEIWHI
jgi:hypothetical protein